MCSALIGSSPRSTLSMSVVSRVDQPLHGRADALLGQAAHLEQPALQRLELLLEMWYGSLHR